MGCPSVILLWARVGRIVQPTVIRTTRGLGHCTRWPAPRRTTLQPPAPTQVHGIGGVICLGVCMPRRSRCRQMYPSGRLTVRQKSERVTKADPRRKYEEPVGEEVNVSCAQHAESTEGRRQ